MSIKTQSEIITNPIAGEAVVERKNTKPFSIGKDDSNNNSKSNL